MSGTRQLDLTKPLPKRTKCAPGSDWFYTDIRYLKWSDKIMSECPVIFDNTIIGPGSDPVPGKLPNGLSYDMCYPSKYVDEFNKNMNDSYTSAYSIPSGCAPGPPEPLCNSNNQLYDSQFQICVSCRDTTVKPTIESSSHSDSNYVNNSVKPNTNYQCKNNPIVLSDLSGKVISQSCNSSETLTNGKCVITFNAKLI